MKKGYLPVRYLEDKNISGFGAVNMSGNAAEWTSSWYDKYEKSLSRDKRYGKQMKVVRGGSWFNNVRRQRISARDCGGIPSLHDDNSFGFRCIKKAGITDILK
jgi:formylglycine-generating enzyme required for sulfatase activity